jgi:hypothetical protein
MERRTKKEKLDIESINLEVQNIKDALAQQSNNITVTIGELLKNLNYLQDRINKINDILASCPNDEVRKLINDMVTERKEINTVKSYLGKKIDLMGTVSNKWTILIAVLGTIITAISYIISHF